MKMNKFLGALLGTLVGGSVGAFAAGVLTNGLPTLPQLNTGTPGIGFYGQPMGQELLPMDTQLPAGAVPQSVAVTPGQLAALGASMAQNTGTCSSNAVTLNKLVGLITTDSLTTPVGSTYTCTVTAAAVKATSIISASIWNLSDVTQARMAVQSITPAAGSWVIVFKNVGAATASGTWTFGFQIIE